jgi:hypothetical protein
VEEYWFRMRVDPSKILAPTPFNKPDVKTGEAKDGKSSPTSRSAPLVFNGTPYDAPQPLDIKLILPSDLEIKSADFKGHGVNLVIEQDSVVIAENNTADTEPSTLGKLGDAVAGGFGRFFGGVQRVVYDVGKTLNLISEATEDLSATAAAAAKYDEALQTGDQAKIIEARLALAELTEKKMEAIRALKATGDPNAIRLAEALEQAKTPGQILAILGEVEAARENLAPGNYGRLILIAKHRNREIVIEITIKAEEARRAGDIEKLKKYDAQLADADKVDKRTDVMEASAKENEIFETTSREIVTARYEGRVELGRAAAVLLKADQELNFLSDERKVALCGLVLASINAGEELLALHAADPEVSPETIEVEIIEWAQSSIEYLNLISAVLENARTAETVRVELERVRDDIEQIQAKAEERREGEKRTEIANEVKKTIVEIHLLTARINKIHNELGIESAQNSSDGDKIRKLAYRAIHLPNLTV